MKATADALDGAAQQLLASLATAKEQLDQC